MSRTPGNLEVDRVGLLADKVVGAVTDCPAVAALAAGPVATYLPGRTVRGVAIRDTDVRISVIARYGPPLAEIAEQVRSAVAPLAPGLRVDVHIDDIQAEGSDLAGSAAGGGAGAVDTEGDHTGEG